MEVLKIKFEIRILKNYLKMKGLKIGILENYLKNRSFETKIEKLNK